MNKCITNTCFFRAGAKIGEWIYYSAADRNALYRVCFDKDTVVLLGIFPEQVLHVKCGQIGDELWFLPENGDFFDVYNIKTNEFRRQDFDVPEGYKVIGNNRRFSAFICDEGKAYITPGAYPYIMVINSFGKIEDYISIPEWYMTDSDGKCHFHFSDGMLKGEWIYLCPECNRYLVRINVKTKETQGIEWKEEQYVNGRWIVWENELYAVPVKRNGEFICVKEDFSRYEKTGIKIDFENLHYAMYVGREGDDLWFCGVDTDRVIRYSLNERRIVNEYREPCKVTSYRGIIENEKELIFTGKTRGESVLSVGANGELKYLSVCEGVAGEIGYLIYCVDEKSKRIADV